MPANWPFRFATVVMFVFMLIAALRSDLTFWGQGATVWLACAGCCLLASSSCSSARGSTRSSSRRRPRRQWCRHRLRSPDMGRGLLYWALVALVVLVILAIVGVL